MKSLFIAAALLAFATTGALSSDRDGVGFGVHVGPLGVGVGVGDRDRREHRRDSYRRGERVRVLPYGVERRDPCWAATDEGYRYVCD